MKYLYFGFRIHTGGITKREAEVQSDLSEKESSLIGDLYVEDLFQRERKVTVWFSK